METARTIRGPAPAVDSDPDTPLPVSRAREILRQGYGRPFLLVDSAIVREKYRCLVAAMPRVAVHYAVKANPDPRIAAVLAEEGAAFEIASIAELDILLSLRIPPGNVHFSNPVKPREYIAYSAAKGVQWFALDCVEEVRKTQGVAPEAKLCLRIDVPDLGSDFPLSSKFGAQADEIDEILDAAAGLGVNLCGVTFHVGSQCRNVENWHEAIDMAKQVFRKMRSRGLTPELLNIGGGFPVRYTKPIPSIDAIGKIVNAAIADLPTGIRVISEPGRYLVSDAACLVCQVIGTAHRRGKHWLYLDTGIFGGLFEITQGLEYEVETDRSGKPAPWQVAGPTCDSDDVLMHDRMLPEDLQAGDFVYFRSAGAYTTAYASGFNGFPLPDIKVV